MRLELSHNLSVGPRSRASMASEPRERPAAAPKALRWVHRSFSEGGSAPAKRRARERVGESEGRSPPGSRCLLQNQNFPVFLARPDDHEHVIASYRHVACGFGRLEASE